MFLVIAVCTNACSMSTWIATVQELHQAANPYKRVFHEHVDCDSLLECVEGIPCTNACSMSTWIETLRFTHWISLEKKYKRVFHEHVD